LKSWTRQHLGSTLLQVVVALALTFAFAAPLALVLLGLQSPDRVPTWFAQLLGAHGGSIPYTSLAIVLVVLVTLWIATSGLTGIVRAATLAREINAVAAGLAEEIGPNPTGEIVRQHKQRLNIERQLIDAHYSLAVIASRNFVFLVVALVVSPAPIAIMVCIAQAYLLRTAVLRYRDGTNVYTWFASIHGRSHGKVGDPAIVTEFGAWLGEWEKKLNALPIRDYLIGSTIVASGIAMQLVLEHNLAGWSHAIPVIGVWAIMTFELSRALAHYGFSIARWDAALEGDFS
jgi:hypothetical protein